MDNELNNVGTVLIWYKGFEGELLSILGERETAPGPQIIRSLVSWVIKAEAMESFHRLAPLLMQSSIEGAIRSDALTHPLSPQYAYPQTAPCQLIHQTKVFGQLPRLLEPNRQLES